MWVKGMPKLMGKEIVLKEVLVRVKPTKMIAEKNIAGWH
jgi:hypothetical protein